MMLFANSELTHDVTVVSNYTALERMCVPVQMVILCVITQFWAH